jgi:hypothetical protein
MKFRLFEHRSSSRSRDTAASESHCHDDDMDLARGTLSRPTTTSMRQRVPSNTLSATTTTSYHDVQQAARRHKNMNIPSIIPPAFAPCSTPRTTMRSLTPNRPRQPPNHLSTGLRRCPSPSPTSKNSCSTLATTAAVTTPTKISPKYPWSSWMKESRCDMNASTRHPETTNPPASEQVSHPSTMQPIFDPRDELAVHYDEVDINPVEDHHPQAPVHARIHTFENTGVKTTSSTMDRNEMTPGCNPCSSPLSLPTTSSTTFPTKVYTTMDELSITSSSSTALFKNGRLYTV